MDSRYNKFTSLILEIYRSIVKIKSTSMADFGLKGNQVQCIFHLNKSEGGLTLNELCERCYEDKGAMSRCVKSLISKGYILQQVGDKKYRNPYVLTASGKQLGEKIDKLTTEMVAKGSSGIKNEERETFYKNLSIVSKNLEDVCKTYGSKNG